jgi:hypothetical protein
MQGQERRHQGAAPDGSRQFSQQKKEQQNVGPMKQKIGEMK